MALEINFWCLFYMLYCKTKTQINMENNNQAEKTASEKLRELEENRKSFMAHVEEENKKFEARKQELIREERVQRMNEQLVWRDNLANRLMKEYNIGYKEIAEMIVSKAWEDGHSYGYGEVTWRAEDLAELVEKVRKIDQSEFEKTQKCSN